MAKRYLVTALVAGVLVLPFTLPGCSVGYYTHTAMGQWEVLRKREPIDELLDDPATPHELRSQLSTALDIRRFASGELGLPDNGSYRSYADLERPYVVWNVFAAPEFSVDAKRWCFPVVGCVSYRGYFDEAKAEAFGEKLGTQGFDYFVGGVPAYSTLGKFDDPVLNTIVHWDDVYLAAIIFHELTHQWLYVKGDSDFSEALATVVEEEGVRRWLLSQGREDVLDEYIARQERRGAFGLLIGRTRERLRELYAGPAFHGEYTLEQKRAAKAEAFAELRREYEVLKTSWGGNGMFDPWFDREVNNAHLVSIATYRKWVPAFRALLLRQGGDLDRFYAAVEALAELDKPARDGELRVLGAISDQVVSAGQDAGQRPADRR